MASRPLPGATYHTADLAFHSCSDVDLEAIDSYGSSEKGHVHLPVQTSQHGTARLRRGPPVMLILLLLCCLSFVASAYMGNASRDLFDVPPLLCVPERQAPRAAQLSAAFRTSPNKEWVFGTQKKALDILYVRTLHCARKWLSFHWLTLRHRKQNYNSSRDGCHAANVRDYMRQTYSIVLVISWRAAFISGLFHTHTPFHRASSLQWTDVSQSAIVLHWQGADSKLRPVIITNTEGLSCSYLPL